MNNIKYGRGMNPKSRNGYKKGHLFYPGSPILKKGHIPWNKGKKCLQLSGKNHPMWGKKHKIESKNKMRLARLGKYIRENNPSWKGGRFIKCNGYIMILKPEHPFADPRGYVYEHRLVMEKIIGRFLSEEERIHHLDGVKTNNVKENLLLCLSGSNHKIIHYKMENFVHKLIRDKKVYYDHIEKEFKLV